MDKLNTIKLFIYENKKKAILLCCLLVLFLLSTFLLFQKNNTSKNNVVYENLVEEKLEANLETSLKEEEIEEEKIYYYVDVKGYVNNPGVYSIEKGKRVVDAINKAGGLKKDANTSLLNLSMEVRDAMVIIVYSNSEINNYQTLQEKNKTTEEICNENIQNDACICNTESNDDVSNVDETSSKDEETSLDEANSKININKASLEELMTLNNIGESKAKAIIEYRTTVGLFKTIEEIKNVSGIGDTIFESLKDYITV